MIRLIVTMFWHDSRNGNDRRRDCSLPILFITD